jgi:hypothetical protein
MDPLRPSADTARSTTYRLSPGMILGVCVVLAPTVVLFGWAIRSTSGLRHTLLVVLIGVLSIFLLWLLLRLGESVVIDDESIERRTPLLGQSRLRWADVTGVEIVDGPAIGRAFRLTSGVTQPIRISDFLARYDDVLADALARVPARALAHAYADANITVRHRLEAAIAGRASVDAEFIVSVCDALRGLGLEPDAALLEQRVVARPRRDVIDSASEQRL